MLAPSSRDNIVSAQTGTLIGLKPCTANVAVGSIASFRRGVNHFRSTPITRRFLIPSACLKGAIFGPGARAIRMFALRLRKRTSPHRLAIFEKPNPDGSLVTALRWRLRSPPNRSVRAAPYGKLYVRPGLIPRPAFTVPIEGTVRLVTPDFMPRTYS